MPLEWIAEQRGRENFAAAAQAINDTIDAALARPETRTADLGGALGTTAFTQRIVAGLGG